MSEPLFSDIPVAGAGFHGRVEKMNQSINSSVPPVEEVPEQPPTEETPPKPEPKIVDEDDTLSKLTS